MQEWWEWVTGWDLLMVWVLLLPVVLAVSVVVAAGQWIVDWWRDRRSGRS